LGNLLLPIAVIPNLMTVATLDASKVFVAFGCQLIRQNLILLLPIFRETTVKSKGKRRGVGVWIRGQWMRLLAAFNAEGGTGGDFSGGRGTALFTIKFDP
jgi:hypothetical protein